MSGIGQRLAHAERAIWGDLDQDEVVPPFQHSRQWNAARQAVRQLRIAEARAVLGLSSDDAGAIEQQFGSHPHLRRAKNFLDHAAAVVRLRERSAAA